MIKLEFFVFSLEVVRLTARFHDCVSKVNRSAATFRPVLANNCSKCTSAQTGAFDQSDFIGSVGRKYIDSHDYRQIEFLAILNVLVQVGQAFGQQIEVFLIKKYEL